MHWRVFAWLCQDIATVPKVYENDAKAQRFFPVKKLEDKFVDVNSDGQAFVTLNNREMDMLYHYF